MPPLKIYVWKKENALALVQQNFCNSLKGPCSSSNLGLCLFRCSLSGMPLQLHACVTMTFLSFRSHLWYCLLLRATHLPQWHQLLPAYALVIFTSILALSQASELGVPNSLLRAPWNELLCSSFWRWLLVPPLVHMFVIKNRNEVFVVASEKT